MSIIWKRVHRVDSAQCRCLMRVLPAKLTTIDSALQAVWRRRVLSEGHRMLDGQLWLDEAKSCLILTIVTVSCWSWNAWAFLFGTPCFLEVAITFSSLRVVTASTEHGLSNFLRRVELLLGAQIVAKQARIALLRRLRNLTNCSKVRGILKEVVGVSCGYLVQVK